MKCTLLLEVEVIALHENFHTSELHDTSELSHVTFKFRKGVKNELELMKSFGHV